MKAAVYNRYGAPEVVHLADVATPVPKDNEVLVRILRKAAGDRPAIGELVSVLERATHRFVGAYHERDGEGLVMDGNSLEIIG